MRQVLLGNTVMQANDGSQSMVRRESVTATCYRSYMRIGATQARPGGADIFG